MAFEPDLLKPLTSGFAISLSLIAAIGAQNVFVIQQGLMRRHTLPVVLFCATSDALLIVFGIFGFGKLLEPILVVWQPWLFVAVAAWLFFYGLLRLRSALAGGTAILSNTADTALKNKSLRATLLMLAAVTWLNPHVYLDTVVLIGALALPWSGQSLGAYTFGAIAASWIFFLALGFGSRAMAPFMQSARAWQALDYAVAFIMMALAIEMLRQGGWFG